MKWINPSIKQINIINRKLNNKQIICSIENNNIILHDDYEVAIVTDKYVKVINNDDIDRDIKDVEMS